MGKLPAILYDKLHLPGGSDSSAPALQPDSVVIRKAFASMGEILVDGFHFPMASRLVQRISGAAATRWLFCIDV